MSERGKAPAIAEMSRGRVKGQGGCRWVTAFHALVLFHARHEALAGREGLKHLAQWLRSIECRLQHELRDIRPLRAAVARDDLATEEVLWGNRGGKLGVGAALDEGTPVQVGSRLSSQRAVDVISEIHIAQHGSPVELHFFHGGLGAGNARRRRYFGGV